MDEQRKAVRAMQEYIKAHFAENITLADLAKASNFSPWYARNLFIKHLGLTRQCILDALGCQSQH